MKHNLLMLSALAVLACQPVKQSSKVEAEMLADTLATLQTREAFTKLRMMVAHGYMVGHQDDLSYGHTWFGGQDGDCKAVCGDYPGVFGWDMGGIEYCDTLNLDSVAFDDMHSYIIKAHEQGAFNTLSWHSGNIVTGSNSWDVSNDKVVASVLEGGEKHQLYLTWLDNFAQYVSSLKTPQGELIPIIFRPYHELGGSWFWWGRNLCSADEYKALWRMTFDYLTKEKNIHNLIYSYSMSSFSSQEEFLERYPGDEYVDMVGFDIYQGTSGETPEEFVRQFSLQTRLCNSIAQQHNKIFAVAEGGFESIPDARWFTDVVDPVLKNQNVSYILFWRNAYNNEKHFYLPYPGHLSAENFCSWVASDSVLMASDARNFKIEF